MTVSKHVWFYIVMILYCYVCLLLIAIQPNVTLLNFSSISVILKCHSIEHHSVNVILFECHFVFIILLTLTLLNIYRLNVILMDAI
jgi:hypothetical protein